MRKIPLTQGQYALVDDTDYDWLNQWKWYASLEKGSYYAVRENTGRNISRIPIRMHRQILGLKRGDKREGDHRDHNTLDNQRHNIRICTHQQNMLNRRKPYNTSSSFRGVY